MANFQPTSIRLEPNISELKILARKLRVALKSYGVEISKPVSLDLIAEVHDHKDWHQAEQKIGDRTN